jgi:type I restriction enzyme S subunit
MTKKDWTVVKVSDCCDQISERVDNPSESGFERFVGLDHMKTREVTIRNWGNSADVTSAMKLFQDGDVLVARRNVYLERAATVRFAGVCSGDAIVLRTKAQSPCITELLPFILNTDQFWGYANSQADGSMSKRLSVARLLDYEFPLPPIDEQRRIAELLWAADDVIEKLAALSESINATYKANAYKIFAELLEGNSPIVRLDEACSRSTQSGLYKNKKFYGSGVGMVHMGELFGNDFIDENVELQKVSLEEKEIETFKLTENDLLFGRRSLVLEGAGRCIYVKKMNEPVTFESSMIRVTLEKERANNQFLFEWFRSPQGDQSINSIRTFTTVAGVKGSDVAKLKIPLPDLEIQMEIVQQLSTIKEKIASASNRLNQAKQLQKTLLENSLKG